MEKLKLFPTVEEARKTRTDFLINQIVDMRAAIEEQFKIAGCVKFALHKTGRSGLDSRGYFNILCDGLYEAAKLISGWAQEEGYEVDHGNSVFTDIEFLYIRIPQKKQ